MAVKGLDDEDFKNQLEEEFQKYLDNKPKKPKVEIVYDASVKLSHPWDELSEQDYRDFMEYVGSEWEDEQYKEKYIRSYNQVLWDCWRVYYTGN